MSCEKVRIDLPQSFAVPFLWVPAKYACITLIIPCFTICCLISGMFAMCAFVAHSTANPRKKGIMYNIIIGNCYKHEMKYEE